MDVSTRIHSSHPRLEYRTNDNKFFFFRTSFYVWGSTT